MVVTQQSFPSEFICPLRQTRLRTLQDDSEKPGTGTGLFCRVKGGTLKEGLKARRDPSRMEDRLGLPIPGPSSQPLSPRYPHQFTGFKLTSSPSFFRKRSSEVAPPPQLRGAGEATLCPRARPRGDDGERAVRAQTPGTGPRLARDSGMAGKQSPLAASPGSRQPGT